MKQRVHEKVGGKKIVAKSTSNSILITFNKKVMCYITSQSLRIPWIWRLQIFFSLQLMIRGPLSLHQLVNNYVW